MFRFAILFFCFGILAYVAGLTQMAGLSMEAGRVLLSAFLIFSILTGVSAMIERERYGDPL